MRKGPARIFVVGTLCGALGVTPCRADESSSSSSPAECRESFEAADLDLKAGPESHLLRARELLRRCASIDCRPWMISACTESLAEVERRIPTVVLTAHDFAKSIVEAEVREGDRWLAHRLDGRATEMEPGEHELVLRLPSGREIARRFVVEEGARLKRLDFEVKDGGESRMKKPSERQAAARTPEWLGTAGWIATATGLGGIAVGTTFGVVAWRAQSDANCDARGLCDAEPLERAHSAASISTASFVIGGGLLAVGLTAVGLSLWGTGRPVAR